MHITPEGDSYFWNPELRIVTPAALTVPEVEKQILGAHTKLKLLCEGKGLPSDIELYLDGDGSQDGQVAYYFVDKRNRHPFWAEPVLTNQLGLDPADTASCLSMSPSATVSFAHQPQLTYLNRICPYG